MLTVKLISKLSFNNTSNYNVEPNPKLVIPSIIPPYIAKDQGNFTIFVLIAPYPDMQAGDVIRVNIGIYTTDGYTVSDYDVGNQINIQITQDTIPNIINYSDNKIPVSYTVDSEKYQLNNTSSISYINVADDSTEDLGELSIRRNIYDNDGGFDAIGEYVNIIASNKPININGKIETYIFITVDNSDKLYYDRILPLEFVDCNLAVLVKLKDFIELAGSNLKIWATAISEYGNDRTVHLSAVSTLMIPGALEVAPPVISEIYFNYNIKYRSMFSTYIYIENNNTIISGDIIKFKGLGNSPALDKLIISDNFSGENIVIPYFRDSNPSAIFKSPAFIFYEVNKEKYTIQSGTAVITPS